MTIAEMEKPNERGLQQVAANERLTFFGLTLPYLLMVTALVVIPVGWLFYLSFIGRDGSFSFENYERMMKSKAYRKQSGVALYEVEQNTLMDRGN